MANTTFTKALSGMSLALVLAACGSSGHSFTLAGGSSIRPEEPTQADPGSGDNGGSGGGDTGAGGGGAGGGAGGGSGGSGSGGSGGGSGGSGGSGGGSTGGSSGSAGLIDEGQNLLGGVLYSTGTLTAQAAGVEGQVGGLVSGIAPTTAPLNDGVTGLLADAGQTVQQTGQTIANDGVTGLLSTDSAGGAVTGLLGAGSGATDGLAAVAVNDTTVGGEASTPLLGVGLAASSQPTGSLATVGASTDGQLLSVGVPAATDTNLNGLLGSGSSVTNGLSATNGLATVAVNDTTVAGDQTSTALVGTSLLGSSQPTGTLATVGASTDGQLLSVSVPTTGTTSLTAPVNDLLGGVTAPLGVTTGATSTTSGSTTTSSGLLGGVTSGLGL